MVGRPYTGEEKDLREEQEERKGSKNDYDSIWICASVCVCVIHCKHVPMKRHTHSCRMQLLEIMCQLSSLFPFDAISQPAHWGAPPTVSALSPLCHHTSHLWRHRHTQSVSQWPAGCSLTQSSWYSMINSHRSQEIVQNGVGATISACSCESDAERIFFLFEWFF